MDRNIWDAPLLSLCKCKVRVGFNPLSTPPSSPRTKSVPLMPLSSSCTGRWIASKLSYAFYVWLTYLSTNQELDLTPLLPSVFPLAISIKLSSTRQWVITLNGFLRAHWWPGESLYDCNFAGLGVHFSPQLKSRNSENLLHLKSSAPPQGLMTQELGDKSSTINITLPANEKLCATFHLQVPESWPPDRWSSEPEYQ